METIIELGITFMCVSFNMMTFCAAPPPGNNNDGVVHGCHGTDAVLG